MYKSITLIYIVVFVTYILFSRQPDYFDGETMPATIHWEKDSTQKTIPKAVFTINKKQYAVDARYVLRNLPEGKQVQIIYETANPEKAAVYSFFGYWITWGELIASILLLVAFIEIAKAINRNPTPEALMEQMEYKPVKKRKYD
ncbi:MAG: hypothetical protein JST29_06000 [Bacteroidetes bacterium]|nr:hypothetical protein [Bacteroidota bacterium]MBS1591649.1 hypothetical protein [Bacteroidota bacterium]MBS1639328.1 hypothetical protein [Bacteroidota bacterium]